MNPFLRTWMSTTKLDLDEVWVKGASPSVRLLKARYQRLGIDRWTNKRIKGLLRAYNITLQELCAFAGVFDQPLIKRYWTKNRWPIPVALHFSLLESFWAKREGLHQFLIRDQDSMEVFLRNVLTGNNNAKPKDS